MSGFREIKDAFRTKCRIKKPSSELALWFTFSNDLLCVHDLEEHKVSMILAIVTDSSIEVRLPRESYGKKLILNAYAKDNKRPEKDLNHKYKLTGFFIFRLLK